MTRQLARSLFIAVLAAQAFAATPEANMRGMLDAPLLFVKHHSYTGIHIYDTYYKWPPGGGGIYVLENPSAPPEQFRIRPVIDGTTPGTLGNGVYTYPQLSYDAKKLLFCYKGTPTGNTCIYEINLDGTGLRQVSDPSPTCASHKGSGGGQHDIAPCYLPDGRIAFMTTRASGLVPCNNTGVAILHVMNADGSDMHPISVNFVNEFDPVVMPDGRILFGRWEYVDKNALTIQSLWSCNPDGSNESAVYANNMVLPEAILQARPVPGSHLICGTFAKHNSTPTGSIAMVDPRVGKNDVKAIANFEHPTNPTFDTGFSCEPWPLSEDVVLFSGRSAGQPRNTLQMLDREGHRFTLLTDPAICLHSPMLIKPRALPPVIPDEVDRAKTTGRFYVKDVYQGLTGVKRGEVKWLRVLEETSRVSKGKGGSPFNQTFLVSAALAFQVKHYLGVVPVDDEGSAYFEVPSGRALFLQALDADGRLIQSMRTFVQAAPGVTRSCIGCHEHKNTAPKNDAPFRASLQHEPVKPRPESWGSGYMDYPSMVQPILDRHCANCHGGPQGFGGGVDLTGGWTEWFNNSYENLVSRRESQLTAWWIAGIDCMNGTAWWSSQLFKPRSHGSGVAPLAKLLVEGHGGRLAGLSRTERDLLMAWIDSNGLYYGTWDTTATGTGAHGWNETKAALTGAMQAAGCVKCHAGVVDNDWFNLQQPELSRILRAPLPVGGDGLGVAFCRDRRQDVASRQRIRLLVNGYAHAVQPFEKFPKRAIVNADYAGEPVIGFASTADAHYQKMLAIIRHGRELALAAPRVDMPGAVIEPGASRFFNPPPVPAKAPAPVTAANPDGVVHVAWEHSADTLGLEAVLYRGPHEGFALDEKALVQRTPLFALDDRDAPPGKQVYALVLTDGEHRSQPAYATVTVPLPKPPATPVNLVARPGSGAVKLSWALPAGAQAAGYVVLRAKDGTTDFVKLTDEPLRQPAYSDATVEPGVPYRYVVKAVSAKGLASDASLPAVGTGVLVKGPVWEATFATDLGSLLLGTPLPGKAVGGAKVVDGLLDTRAGGHVAYPHQSEFDLAQPLTLTCWLRLETPTQMPIPVSCGLWQQSGWFLQQLGGRWRWHVAGIDCDGGRPPLRQWLHVACTFDGKQAAVYQNGELVAQATGTPRSTLWTGDLLVGEYSGIVGPEFQFKGQLGAVRVYHRVLGVGEIKEEAKVAPGAGVKVAWAR